MFDIHYHLLFDLDDGPRTIEESVELAEASIAEGVTHIVATPHANDKYAFEPELNRERLAMLRERLGDSVTLGLGCDFHLSYDNLEDLAKDRSKYTINGQQYLLVEFSDFGIPQNVNEVFFQMQTTGTIPIITHPERNPAVRAEPARLAKWIAEGCLVQVTAASLTGRFGDKSRSISLDMIRNNWVHFIASDAHHKQRRGPAMGPAYAMLKEQFGEETANRLCVDNPRAAFEGEPLPYQPEPLSPHDYARRKGFWSRLMGR